MNKDKEDLSRIKKSSFDIDDPRIIDEEDFSIKDVVKLQIPFFVVFIYLFEENIPNFGLLIMKSSALTWFLSLFALFMIGLLTNFKRESAKPSQLYTLIGVFSLCELLIFLVLKTVSKMPDAYSLLLLALTVAKNIFFITEKLNPRESARHHSSTRHYFSGSIKIIVIAEVLFAIIFLYFKGQTQFDPFRNAFLLQFILLAVLFIYKRRDDNPSMLTDSCGYLYGISEMGIYSILYNPVYPIPKEMLVFLGIYGMYKSTIVMKHFFNFQNGSGWPLNLKGQENFPVSLLFTFLLMFIFKVIGIESSHVVYENFERDVLVVVLFAQLASLVAIRYKHSSRSEESASIAIAIFLLSQIYLIFALSKTMRLISGLSNYLFFYMYIKTVMVIRDYHHDHKDRDEKSNTTISLLIVAGLIVEVLFLFFGLSRYETIAELESAPMNYFKNTVIVLVTLTIFVCILPVSKFRTSSIYGLGTAYIFLEPLVLSYLSLYLFKNWYETMPFVLGEVLKNMSFHVLVEKESKPEYESIQFKDAKGDELF